MNKHEHKERNELMGDWNSHVATTVNRAPWAGTFFRQTCRDT